MTLIVSITCLLFIPDSAQGRFGYTCHWATLPKPVNLPHSFTQSDVERYKRLRALGMYLSHRILNTAPRRALQETGEAIGILRDGTFLLDTKDVTDVLMVATSPARAATARSARSAAGSTDASGEHKSCILATRLARRFGRSEPRTFRRYPGRHRATRATLSSFGVASRR